MSELITTYRGTVYPRNLDHEARRAVAFDEDIAARARDLVVEMPEEP